MADDGGGELKTPWGVGERYGKYQKIVEVTKKYHTHALRTALVAFLVFVISGSQIILYPRLSLGASYTFVQTSWLGGLDVVSVAAHPTDQTNWSKYSTSTSIVAGSNIKLATTTATLAQTDDTNSNTGFNLTGAVNSSTTVSGTGSSASVVLGQSFSGALATTTLASNASPTNTSFSMTLGADGFPDIVHSLTSSLKMTKCTNSSCTTSSTVVLATTQTGTSNFIAIGSDGYPRIAYSNSSSLYLLKCNNTACSSFSSTTVATDFYNQANTSGIKLVIGADGFARIAYASNAGGGGVNFLQCTNDSCSTSAKSVVVAGDNYSAYVFSIGMDLGLDGFARIVTEENDSLSGTTWKGFAQCTNASCSTKVYTQVMSYGGNMNGISVKVASDGFARIITEDGNYIQCTNAACTTNVSRFIDNTTYAPSLALSNGLPRIPYRTGARYTRYAVCANASCSSASTSTLDSDFTNSGYGQATDIAMGAAGYPFIAYPYYNGSVNFLRLAYPISSYYNSGIYTSGPINIGFGVASWGNLSWTSSGGQTITMKARSSATSDFSGATAWSSCSNITSGQALSTGGCVTNGHQYIQYQATLSTNNVAATPSLDSVSIGYGAYASSGSLISSVYDTSDSTNIMGSLAWTEDSSLPSGVTTTVSLRSASTTALLAAASWTDLNTSSTGCAKVGAVVTCGATALPAAMKTSGGNRYFQYKVGESSTGANTPTISNVTVTYVVNAPPQFNASFGTSGVSANQTATSTDPNFGKVQIQYSVRDPDTNAGSNTPGYITPSFSYSTNGGSSWVPITAQYLASGDTDNKAVSTSTYAVYSATWDIRNQVPGVYLASLQVKVTLNDNEAANSTASQAITFGVDTKTPALNSLSLDVSQRKITFNLSDDSAFQYLLTNNSDASSSDLTNASSGVWASGISSSSIIFNNWSFESDPVVYGSAKDALGNSLTFSAVAPSVPTNMDIKDTSNPAINSYHEFLSWKLYTSTSSATFARYELYRSTDTVNYNLLSNITDQNQNYYTDNAVSSSTTYSYKVRVADTDGDTSDYSTVVSDKPDGQGGTDFTPPTISAATVPSMQPTWAKITWTTDEIADSRVEYSIDRTYSLSGSNTALVTDHSIVLQDLAPNTVYYYRVKSKDPFNNQATDDNSGNGYSFTTPGGPAISAVAVTSVSDKTATITWNTDRDSDSYVVYATDPGTLETGIGVTTVGYATSTTVHTVTVSGLTTRTKYYFYVQSTDPSTSYTGIDNNGGNYYYFGTTYDIIPPVLSEISTPVISQNSTVVVWQTDELATGWAQYGTISGTYDKSTIADNKLSIYHTALLPSLDPSTEYYYKLFSIDAAGNTGSSTEQTVKTADPGNVTIVQNIVSGGGSAPAPQTDTAPPAISDIKVDSIGAFDAKITFNTNEAATSYVEVGEDIGYGKVSGEPSFSSQHSVSLYGLKLGTKYHFRVKAVDRSGNISISDDQTFQTKFIAEAAADLHTIQNAEQFQNQLDNLVSSVLPSLAPPFLGEVTVTGVTDSAATITWTTNGKTYGSVAYSTNDQYSASSTYVTEVSESQGKSDLHTLNLVGLTPSTLYHFVAKSFVFPGVVGTSPDKTFATKAAPIVPTITNVTNSSFVVSWITEKPTDSYVELKDSKTGKTIQVGSEEKTKNHVVTVDKLTPASGYSVHTFGHDANGVLIEGENATVVLKKDIQAPQITSVSMSNAFIPNRQDQLQTVISWKTDEPGTSMVYYEEGLGTNAKLANSAGNSSEYVTAHTVIIPNFKPGTVYRFQVESDDQAGNKGLTPIRTVVTPASSQSVFDVIVKNFEDVFGFFGNVGK